MATDRGGNSGKSRSLSSSQYLIDLAWFGAILYGIAYFLGYAYQIRLQAIKEYGPVIHEFDPYFNWRATQVSNFSCAIGICAAVVVVVVVRVVWWGVGS
jgi:hypothetical protein